ncbi:hypothetical protein chiPu_0002916 [Chiloscyllium punctatum]|uniref:Uncharacterized protein n=1 Tax=Chiloscyllium punctatum TaxID=137246 RepID=A0A401S287_CHIPU|nr:hypothetical protein [Chiloscyllium punctatum]
MTSKDHTLKWKMLVCPVAETAWTCWAEGPVSTLKHLEKKNGSENEKKTANLTKKPSGKLEHVLKSFTTTAGILGDI